MREARVLQGLQERLGIAFHDEALLLRALRHRSATLDQPLESNERLEFLGDSIVGLVVCDALYRRFPEASEGDLAKAKAYLVSEPTLAEAALALGLDEAVELSEPEAAAGGRRRRSIMADTFEAFVAAAYLDSGIRCSRKIVRRALDTALRRVVSDDYHDDYKSALQELLQARSRKTPRYRIAAETGADHDKTFEAQALIGSKVLGEGTGKSKKEAEQAAARDALAKHKG